MLDTIPVFEDNLLTHELVDNFSPMAFNAYNKSLKKTFCIYPYIVNGNFYHPPNDHRKSYSNGLIENIFRLKSEIYYNEEDTLQRIFKPDMYDYDYNVIRQVVIDTSNNSIVQDTGAIKLFTENADANVMKLNHRWYTPKEQRAEYLKTRKILNFCHQANVKQQWLLGKNMGIEIMYETREKSNSLWKNIFKIDGDFFNEENGWFYTENRVNVRNFNGWPLIWYDKEKHTKESALEYLSKL